MGILTNIIAAEDDEIEAMGESQHPVAEWSGIEMRDIDTAKIATLHSLLTGDLFDDAIAHYEPVYVSAGEGSVLLRLTDGVVRTAGRIRRRRAQRCRRRTGRHRGIRGHGLGRRGSSGHALRLGRAGPACRIAGAVPVSSGCIRCAPERRCPAPGIAPDLHDVGLHAWKRTLQYHSTPLHHYCSACTRLCRSAGRGRDPRDPRPGRPERQQGLQRGSLRFDIAASSLPETIRERLLKLAISISADGVIKAQEYPQPGESRRGNACGTRSLPASPCYPETPADQTDQDFHREAAGRQGTSRHGGAKPSR